MDLGNQYSVRLIEEVVVECLQLQLVPQFILDQLLAQEFGIPVSQHAHHAGIELQSLLFALHGEEEGVLQTGPLPVN